ncbi:hypothetical protein K502DRAFT_42179 [Neoconidiobolus thromboides FSU 785]|nr:hypothetical protein K502DRAFT_42179 [Neoconidiobolus thromboides FSU 785]
MNTNRSDSDIPVEEVIEGKKNPNSTSFLSIFNQRNDNSSSLNFVEEKMLNNVNNLFSMLGGNQQKNESYNAFTSPSEEGGNKYSNINIDDLFDEEEEKQRTEEANKKSLDYQNLEKVTPQTKKVIDIQKKRGDSPFSYVNPFDAASYEPFSDTQSHGSNNTITENDIKVKTNEMDRNSYKIAHKDLFFDHNKFDMTNIKEINPSKHTIFRNDGEMILPNGNSIFTRLGLVGFYSKDSDSKLRIWNEISTKKQVIEDHDESIIDIAIWKPSNETIEEKRSYLMTLSSNFTVSMYSFDNQSTQKGEIKYNLFYRFKNSTMPSNTKWYTHIAWDPASLGSFVLASNELGVKLFQTNFKHAFNYEEEQDIYSKALEVNCNKPIMCIKFSPNGNLLGIGFENGVVSIIGLHKGEQIFNKTIQLSEIHSISYIEFVVNKQREDILIVGINKNTNIILYNLTQSTIVQTFKFKINTKFISFNSLCYEHQNKLLFVGCNIRRVLLCFHFNESVTTFDYVTEIAIPEGFIEICVAKDSLNSHLKEDKSFILTYILQQKAFTRYAIGLNNLIIQDVASLNDIPDKCILIPRQVNDDKNNPPSLLDTFNKTKNSPNNSKNTRTPSIKSNLGSMKSPENLKFKGNNN